MKRISLFILLAFFVVLTTWAKDINLAKYRVVIHSSSYDESQCGHLVVDGSLGTFWESKPGGEHWISIDLGSVQKIEKVAIKWGANYGTDFKVSASAKNKITGEEIFSGHNRSGQDELISCAPLNAQFIRVDISKVKDPIRGCVIKEIEVIGEGPERFVASSVSDLSMKDLSLNGNIWRIQNALFVNDSPKDISATSYNDREWIPASVPGTVMGSYQEFGALPDPFYGDNMHQISDEFFSGNDFWYRSSVRFPSEVDGKRLFLNFAGVNWKADVYFNSEFLGRIDGAFQRAEFEITKLISNDQANTVAVLIHHPEHWVSGNHKVVRKHLRARTTNGDMLGIDSPIFLAPSGWNWLPVIKGRNIGIWNDATLKVRENVSINDPWVSSVLLLPDTTKAELSIHADLKNQSDEAVEGILVVSFGKTKIKHSVKLKAGENRSIVLDKSQYPKLFVKNPKLWWPNGYGEQNLYKLSLQFFENGKISDADEINFGIRQLDYKVTDNILFVYCNGQRLLLRGGNWGMPEGMMRCDSSGYDLRVKLHKEANFNMIRNWIGMTGDEEFYDACDKYGLLIWDDFWLANPVDGPDPKDNVMFMNNVRDKIKWVRKHPSLALYCGRNEGLPPLELDVAMKQETQLLDGTRHYIPHSAAGTVTGLGPYDVREPLWYFKNRGITLHSELGIVSFPEAESLRRMMPEKDLWPINNMWAVHDYQWGRSEKFTARIEDRFGKPFGYEDYCRRAQMLNYETARAMFECLQSNQGSGVLLWMSQSAWPSMICQLYDHYFEYTAAFFAAKKASQPIHILWDIARNEIRVANNTSKNKKDLSVRAAFYDLNGTKLMEKSMPIKVLSSSAVTCMDFNPENEKNVRFMKLELLRKGKVITDNFYWFENEAKNCADLNSLPKVDIELKAASHIINGVCSATVSLRNTSSSVTLLNKIKVKNGKTGESILPVFYSDNYISLLPGESKVIDLEFEIMGDNTPELLLEGWNTIAKKISL